MLKLKTDVKLYKYLNTLLKDTHSFAVYSMRASDILSQEMIIHYPLKE
jgi:hypothetical protein